ncbi:CLUMA_CG003602, isoform A [Clunio marinus]|uniref:CLUMA_CG003602, isoform A n=1 Tax=Clunio marinus TaxID=568069 RepID=A0A1J1HU20_9DIPT|nr:CLUMA_CG003602, isoform A [Clunio marinus]
MFYSEISYQDCIGSFLTRTDNKPDEDKFPPFLAFKHANDKFFIGHNANKMHLLAHVSSSR